MAANDNSYNVYIGNLSITVSKERLQNLFCEIGEISSIWINHNFLMITYAFVGFDHLTDAKKACEQCNNHNLDGHVINVKLSEKTEKKLNNSIRKKTSRLVIT